MLPEAKCRMLNFAFGCCSLDRFGRKLEPAASGGARKNSIQYAANASSNFPPVSTGSRYEYRYKVGVPVQGRSTGKR